MKRIWVRNKHIVADIARCAQIPEKEAKVVLQTICKYLVKRIREDKIVNVELFGRFKWYVQKVRLTKGVAKSTQNKTVPGKKARVAFSMSAQMRRDIGAGPLDSRRQSYPYVLRRKILRLEDAGLTKKAKRFRIRLKEYLRDKPTMVTYLAKNHGIPYGPGWRRKEVLFDEDKFWRKSGRSKRRKI